MSVITRELSADHFDLYAKGSPEMIASMCRPDTGKVDHARMIEWLKIQLKQKLTNSVDIVSLMPIGVYLRVIKGDGKLTEHWSL